MEKASERRNRDKVPLCRYQQSVTGLIYGDLSGPLDDVMMSGVKGLEERNVRTWGRPGTWPGREGEQKATEEGRRPRDSSACKADRSSSVRVT